MGPVQTLAHIYEELSSNLPSLFPTKLSREWIIIKLSSLV